MKPWCNKEYSAHARHWIKADHLTYGPGPTHIQLRQKKTKPYSGPLSNTGLNCASLLTCVFLSIHTRVLHNLRRAESTDAEPGYRGQTTGLELPWILVALAGPGTNPCLDTEGWQSALHVQFHIHRFNQPWIKSIREKNSRKFQKTKLEFAEHRQLHHLHCIGYYK